MTVSLSRPRTTLQASEERFRLLVESVKDYGIFILSPEGYIETWNAGAERLNGYTRDEIVGKHFSIFYPPPDIEAGKCELDLELTEREGRFEDEGWRLRKDGTRFWANVTITALRDDSDTLLGFAKVTRDLTERKLAEEAVRRFRLVIESVKDYGIFILSPTGYVETWNAGAERLKQYTAHEIVGKHFSVFYPSSDIAAGKCEMELAGAARDGRYEDEGWRLRKDGSLFWANVTITALRDDAGTLVGFAKVTRDLTERKEGEERLRAIAAERAALAEKAHVQEFQERFLAILGHDLRNPLAAIEMGAALLRRQEPLSAMGTRILDRVEASTRRMSRMIEQILDLTRSRLAGALEVTAAPADMHVVLTAVVDELLTAHPTRAIELRGFAFLGSWDSDRLEQVFSNLIGNAIHYGTPDKPVRVDMHADGDVIHVDVHNEGPTIADELRVELFNPFRRGTRDSRTAGTAGLGLGLYISREILVAHGGAIVVRSSAAEGTTFRVSLPRTQARPDDEANAR
jgi:PAS domain S-box-containing protein